MNASWFQWQDETLILRLHVQPRARCNQVSGLYMDRLKVRIAASPANGKANDCLTSFLAEEFGITRGQVRLLSGHTGRDKRVAIVAPRKKPAWFAPLA